MRYRFADYTLIPAVLQLTKSGESVDVPKRVFECICYLIEHRQRAIGRDELIRVLWARDNVSDNQLAQVVRAARHVLDDDGAAQRLIRTVSGLGYHWVGDVTQVADPVVAAQAQAMEKAVEAPSPALANAAGAAPEALPPLERQAAALISEPRTATIVWHRGHKLLALVALVLTLVVVASIGWQLREAEPAAVTVHSAAATAMDPLARLEDALWRGSYEEVREGLATLPADLADSPDARLLDIRLDMERGRFDRAAQKLSLQKTRAKAAADHVWQAKLLTSESDLSAVTEKWGQDVLVPAEQAITLLDSAGDAVSPQVMGHALIARGNAFLINSQFEPATYDLIRARDMLEKIGDMRRAATARRLLAHTWLRMGRLTDALEEMLQVASTAQQSSNSAVELVSRNTATKIQIELLRSDEALINSQRNVLLSKTMPDSVRRVAAMQLRALVLTGSGRLREAGSLLEEVEATSNARGSPAVFAVYQLASGRPEQALVDAADGFAKYNASDKLNLILENKEGALLLWMIAAQDLAANGKAMPVPSLTQRKALEQPESGIGHIARGRWLWSQGQSREAEVYFRLSLAEARQRSRPFHMLLAGEPLIELLLQRGDTTAAAQVLAVLRAHDPDRMDKDYRANLLGLRVALALGEKADIVLAYQRTVALAGERTLPAQVLVAYEAGLRSPGDRKGAQNSASRF